MMMETTTATPNSNLLLPEDPSTTTSPVAVALFPVTFFDGEREIDVGSVPITPSLTFKSFQSILSSKLQISPHQITIYFQRPNFNEFHHHHRRRHAVTSKFDFENAMAEPDSSFYVVQKRSRRTRRRKPKVNNNGVNNNGNNFVLLKRDNNFNYNYNNNYNNIGNCNLNEYLEYMSRMRIIQEVEREREKYMMSMNLNSNVYEDLSFGYGGGGGYYGNFSDDAASSSSSSVFCDVCYNAAVRGDETVPFHGCKNDVVTRVHRSPAGPIAPPTKKKNMVDLFV